MRVRVQGDGARGRGRERPGMPPQGVHSQVAGALKEAFKPGQPGVGFQLTYQLGGREKVTSGAVTPPSRSRRGDRKWQAPLPASGARQTLSEC